MNQQTGIEVFEKQDFSGLVVLWAYKVASTSRVLKVGQGWASAEAALTNARAWAYQNKIVITKENVEEPSLSLIFG